MFFQFSAMKALPGRCKAAVDAFRNKRWLRLRLLGKCGHGRRAEFKIFARMTEASDINRLERA